MWLVASIFSYINFNFYSWLYLELEIKKKTTTLYFSLNQHKIVTVSIESSQVNWRINPPAVIPVHSPKLSAYLFSFLTGWRNLAIENYSSITLSLLFLSEVDENSVPGIRYIKVKDYSKRFISIIVFEGI